MNKFYTKNRRIPIPNIHKLGLIMRLTIVILLGTFLHVSASTFAQKVTLSGKNASLETLFTEIGKQTGYGFIYTNETLKNTHRVDIDLKQVSLDEALKSISRNQPIEFDIQKSTIIVKLKEESGVFETLTKFLAPPINIRGRVVDTLGKPLVGATVKARGIRLGVTTNYNGEFMLARVDSDSLVSFSYLGHVTRELKAAPDMGTIVLKIKNSELEEAEVNTGMFTRKKETFTGVTSTFTGKELRDASRQNILEGLNMLDPSFNIIRDNSLGSDPNQLPKVEIRGSRSIPPPTPTKYSQQLKLEYELDPNQPLFILDGFETSLSTIINLDVNRVASITLLKDAASTSLYGSRSANGVVIVETIPPTPGAIRVSFNSGATLALPDLSGYNMMNAKELLTFQELASEGANAPGPYAALDDKNLLIPQMKHAFRENAIMRGVDANWKNVPLQYSTAFNNSVSVSGGDSYFNYTVGLSRGQNVGVMKGSENSNTSGYANLTYRNGKININNNLTIGGTNQKGSPYGSFSQYVRIPSYYAIDLESRYLEDHKAEYFTANNVMSSMSYRFANPLFNAQLPHKNTTDGLSISNNLMFNWDIYPFLRASSGFQYARSEGHSDYFISPLSTQFDNSEITERGSYSYSASSSENYRGYLTLTYNKVFAEKHIFNLNVRSDVSQTTQNSQSTSAVGFAATADPILYLANSYSPDSKPNGSSTLANSVAFIGSMNYSYDMRYNLDLSYNLSGTSSFGSDNPFQSFYSMGLGWNIGRESFLKDSRIVNHLNLSANFGLTGNQNAGNFGSRSTYQLNSRPTYFGEAVQLVNMGNPNLDWTKTFNLSYSLSGSFFDKKISMSLNGYRNLTDPLIINMPMAPSVGMPSGIPKNIGKLTSNGLELTIDTRLVSTRNWTVNLGLNAPVYYKAEYSGLGDALEKYNDSARNNGFLQRYTDGSSPDAIWAVRSLGIGQAEGFEVFLDKEGNYTYVFDKNYEVAVGNSRPVTQGRINMRVRYKRFTVSMYSRYVVEEMKFNSALYNKVENISPSGMEFNQDKRALYVRWQNVGDDASFLGIKNSVMGMSSRFLQKENALFIDGVSFNYDLLDQYSEGVKSYIRKKLGFQTLNFGVSTNNIFQFRLSNVKVEKGLDYPFQRSVTVNMNLTF